MEMVSRLTSGISPNKEDAIETIIERRSVSRFLFSSDDKISLTLEDRNKNILKADILNLSEEGLGLNFKINPTPALKPGDRFYILEIKGLPSSEFLRSIEMEVKWILRYQPTRGARSGCEFTNNSEMLRKNIRKLINEQISKRAKNTEG